LRVAVESNMCRTVNIYAAFQQILRFVQHNRELAKREMGKGVSGKGKRVMGNAVPWPSVPLPPLFAMQK